jgi:hypothetical protein
MGHASAIGLVKAYSEGTGKYDWVCKDRCKEAFERMMPSSTVSSKTLSDDHSASKTPTAISGA